MWVVGRGSVSCLLFVRRCVVFAVWLLGLAPLVSSIHHRLFRLHLRGLFVRGFKKKVMEIDENLSAMRRKRHRGAP